MKGYCLVCLNNLTLLRLIHPDSSYKCTSILQVITVCFAAYRLIFAVPENITRWRRNQHCNMLSFLSPCLPPLSFHYFLCMPLYLSFRRFTSFIGSSVFNFYRLWVLFPDFLFFLHLFLVLKHTLKTFCQSDFGCFFHFLFCILLFFMLFSISFFDFP
jgi:hypothetical protein